MRLASRFGTVLRTERGHLTQQQLADRAKPDRKTVDRLENGRRRPTSANIWKIARALRSELRSRAETSTTDERRRVLKLLVKDVLIGPEKITIRHRIPLRERITADAQPDSTDRGSPTASSASSRSIVDGE